MISGGSIEDRDLGLINVYREYIDSKGVVEYTTFFRKGGKKYRHDFVLEEKSPYMTSEEVRQLIIDDINAGNNIWDCTSNTIWSGTYE